eukprot:TRINITY_DN2716_c0_g1_i2.p1 TRINITY_DN2716_c0_g1~~TRINITY_DN2716_c0_g1_i2.p1  ORF type:complete len:144 (-),score=27.48 TRINITY_DN2716_c0_g1_i2:74-505(-)
MDHGTDAVDFIMGRVVSLKFGFTPVINRSHYDIIKRKSIYQAVKDEQEYFQQHPRYQSIANQCGTLYLSKTLNQILIDHISNTLPDLKALSSSQLLPVFGLSCPKVFLEKEKFDELQAKVVELLPKLENLGEYFNQLQRSLQE